MPKQVFVSTDQGVGILQAIDSRFEDGKYRVMLNGNLSGFTEVSRITEAEYKDKLSKQKPVATTKPKRGAKK